TLIIHWDGSIWRIVPSPNSGANTNELYGAAAVSANDVWAVGYYINVSGTYQSLVQHWDGSAWSVIPSPNIASSDNILRGVAAISTNAMWVLERYDDSSSRFPTLMEHWDGSMWSVIPSPDPGTTSNVFQGVAAVSANDVWAVGFYDDGSLVYRTVVEHYTSPC